MNNKSTKKTINFNYVSVVLIFIWIFAFLFFIPSIKDAESRTFPLIVTILSIVLTTILLLKTYFKWGKKEDFDFSGSQSALFMGVLLLIYITATAVVGFYLATPFYLYISMWVLGQKNKKIMLIISMLTPLFVYLFFDLLLSMRIQQGLLVPWLMNKF